MEGNKAPRKEEFSVQRIRLHHQVSVLFGIYALQHSCHGMEEVRWKIKEDGVKSTTVVWKSIQDIKSLMKWIPRPVASFVISLEGLLFTFKKAVYI